MVVLVDANIIIDVLQYRSPFDADARQILTLCAQKKVTGILAAHTIPTLFYVMRKFYDQQLLRKTLAKRVFFVHGRPRCRYGATIIATKYGKRNKQ